VKNKRAVRRKHAVKNKRVTKNRRTVKSRHVALQLPNRQPPRSESRKMCGPPEFLTRLLLRRTLIPGPTW
jgi:hypothetical protein